MIADRACSLQILLVSDHSVVLLIQDVVITLLLPTNASSESAVVTNELKITKYVGDNVHVHQAVVIRTGNKQSASQCTVAAWVSTDVLCILCFHCSSCYCYCQISVGLKMTKLFVYYL